LINWSSFDDTEQEDIRRDICNEQLHKNEKQVVEFSQANGSS